jgi:hypothetical protein
MYRKRVDTGLEFVSKHLIDHAMAGYSTLPPEGISHDIDPEVGFSTRPVSGVAFMANGFVEHLQALRSEGFSQLPRNGFLHTHREPMLKHRRRSLSLNRVNRPASTRSMFHWVCQACAAP